MKVIASPIILNAFEWDGSKETFKKIQKLAGNIEDDVYMRDSQLIIYNNTYEEEEVVTLGHYVVFENYGIEVYSPISFEVMYQEVADEVE